MIHSEEIISINILTKCKDVHKWLKRKGTATVDAKYIHYSCPCIQQVGNIFLICNEDYA